MVLILDLRMVFPEARHPIVRRRLDGLAPGETLRVVNDHDPAPLRAELDAERPGRFIWTGRDHGPEAWSVDITTVDAAPVAPGPGDGSEAGSAAGGAACCGGDPSGAPSHDELLATAHAVRRAAVDDDAEQLHAQLTRLRNDLTRHLRLETAAMARLAIGPRAVAADGQRRLLALVDEVLGAVHDEDGDDGRCPCLVRAAQIDVALRRQAAVEARLIGPPVPGR